MQTDTIAAIATALSDSGIGIIRVSGKDAIGIVDSVFLNKYGKRNLLHIQSHTIHYGFITDIFRKDNPMKVHFKENILYDKDGQRPEDNNLIFHENDPDNAWKNDIVDEVMVSVMKAPNSYTREDTVEINCHGGVYVVKRILDVILQAGARLAEPGEFTKRAFLNGRIDLSKAEAVMDLIHSQNELSLKSSVSQLRGDLSDEIGSLRKDILYEIAFIESALDDPEHVSLDGYPAKLKQKLSYLIPKLQKWISSADNGKLIKEGISTVILGKPNAGKSSLLNILLGQDRAIVTDIAGTTRDILEEHINLHGISLNIIDTAGIRHTEDTVEKMGIERARNFAKDADLILYVADTTVGLDDSDREIISLIGDKPAIVLLNKSDMESVISVDDILKELRKLLPSRQILIWDECGSKKMSEYSNFISEFHADKSDLCDFHFFDIVQEREKSLSGNIAILKTSTKNLHENQGMEELENVVKEMFFSGSLKENHELVITNMRHKEALQHSLDSLHMVMQSIEDGMEEDFFSIDLMSAYSQLGKIIGEEVEDDLVEEIFSKFCMGK